MDEIFLEDEKTGLYVSNLGRVGGIRVPILKQTVVKDYYRIEYTRPDGRQAQESVHRMVARTFLSNPNNLPCVNHKDENKLNNRVDNLEFCTQLYNARYGTKNARMIATRNMRHSEKAEKPITLVNADGNDVVSFKSFSEAAQKLGVSLSGICQIANGTRKSVCGWHLPGVMPGLISKPKAISFTNDKGEVRTFHSRRAAHRALGIATGTISKMIKGTIKTSASWSIVGMDTTKHWRTKPFSMISPNGDIVTFKDRIESESKTGLSRSSITKLKSSRSDSVRGWRMAK